MTGLRIALVTRRFWPLVGGAEVVMANLAAEFRRQGHEPLVVTARWNPEWPGELVHRDVPVRRLSHPPQRGWGTLRYMLALRQWLHAQRPALDGVCVSMLKHDAYTAVRTLRSSPVPVILRAEGGGETGDCRWQAVATCGARIRRRCQEADAVVAVSDAVRDELLAAGYDAPRVVALANGVAVGPWPPPDVARGARQASRLALGEAHADLVAAPDTPVAVYAGRLHAGKGLCDLIAAWPRVRRELPTARLWLVGDGDAREALYQQVKDLELLGQVVLPGAFDSVEDVLRAADVFVLPSYAEGLSLALLEAMAAGLPVVASRIPGNIQLVAHEVTGWLVPPRSPAELAPAIVRALTDRGAAVACARRAHAQVRQQYSLERMATAHLDLLRTCRRRRHEGHL